MPTREIAHCLERLRGLTECLDAILDSPGHVTIAAAVFLAAELKQAIDDLDNHLPHGSMIKEDCILKLTCWPDYVERDNSRRGV